MKVKNNIDQKKLKAELECDERKNNLYRLIPRLQEIDNELNSFAFKTAKNILNNSLLSDNSNNSEAFLHAVFPCVKACKPFLPFFILQSYKKKSCNIPALAADL